MKDKKSQPIKSNKSDIKTSSDPLDKQLILKMDEEAPLHLYPETKKTIPPDSTAFEKNQGKR